MDTGVFCVSPGDKNVIAIISSVDRSAIRFSCVFKLCDYWLGLLINYAVIGSGSVAIGSEIILDRAIHIQECDRGRCRMKVSVIVATRNRSTALRPCLDSIATALVKGAPQQGEIVVVDNGSTDDTPAALKAWAENSHLPVQLLTEPVSGLTRAQNCAIRASRGELLVFTDDDCRMDEDYIATLLRLDAANAEVVLRGGRVELGDPTDLPLTIFTERVGMRWKRSERTMWSGQNITGRISGCNMAMRRDLIEKVGFFNENFGSGSYINSSGDIEFVYRAYVADITVEYEPSLVIHHFHGRKRPEDGQKLMRKYAMGTGAVYARFMFRHPIICLGLYRTIKGAFRECFTGKNSFMPSLNIRFRDVLASNLKGIMKYALMQLGIRYGATARAPRPG